MATQKIEYQNKVAIDDVGVPEKNKITANNMNEIKEVVNNNADNFDETTAAINERIDTANNAINNIVENTYTKSETNNLLSSKADKSEIPTDLSQLSNATTKFVNETQLQEETTARENADNNLQGQIDAIVASSDVVDIVGTYQELENYDTSHLGDNDIIKVLQDSTHNNATSYYRWKKHTSTWQYIGSEGPFYTKGETDTLVNAKYTKPSGGIPKTDLDSSVQTSLGKADSALQTHQDISGKQDITDNNLTTTNKTIPTAINEVNSIAKGANQALSYGNYSTMITAFNSLANDVYNVGQNVMIITLQVPDLWISGIESTSQTYTYVDDATIVNDLQTNGYIQAGYYKLSMLETQKVDLTNYVTNTDYASSNTGGVIKISGSRGTSVTSSGFLGGYTRTYGQYNEDVEALMVSKGTLENVITGKGLVSNTDYATAEKGGTIRTSNASGLGISNGNLYAVTKAYNTYNSASDNMFIGKGTLENVITGKNLETGNNKVTTISSSSTNTQYPSAKAVYDYIQSLDGDEVSY